MKRYFVWIAAFFFACAALYGCEKEAKGTTENAPTATEIPAFSDGRLEVEFFGGEQSWEFCSAVGSGWLKIACDSKVLQAGEKMPIQLFFGDEDNGGWHSGGVSITFDINAAPFVAESRTELVYLLGKDILLEDILTEQKGEYPFSTSFTLAMKEESIQQSGRVVVSVVYESDDSMYSLVEGNLYYYMDEGVACFSVESEKDAQVTYQAYYENAASS